MTLKVRRGFAAEELSFALKTDAESPAGQAHISINDKVQPVNISALNSRASYHGVVPVQLVLKPGDANILRFGATGASGVFSLPRVP